MENVTCTYCQKLRLGVCVHDGKEKHIGSPACSDFIMREFIWCNKNDQWLDVIACLSRQSKYREGCVRCRQGKHVEDAYYVAHPKQRRKQFVLVEKEHHRIETVIEEPKSRRRQCMTL